MKKEVNPIENAVAMFRKWKGDRDDDYVYDEIHEFTVEFSRAELAGLMNYLEQNEKALTVQSILHCFTDAELKERDRAIAGDVKHVFEHGENCKNYHTACDNCLHEYYEWYKLKDQGSAMRLKRS